MSFNRVIILFCVQGRIFHLNIRDGVLDLVKFINAAYFHSVQFSSFVICIFVTPWTATCQASLCITNSWSKLKIMSIESVMPSNHLIL